MSAMGLRCLRAAGEWIQIKRPVIAEVHLPSTPGIAEHRDRGHLCTRVIRFDFARQFRDGQRGLSFFGNAVEAAHPLVMPSQDLLLEGDGNPCRRHDRKNRAGSQAGDEMAPKDTFTKSHA